MYCIAFEQFQVLDTMLDRRLAFHACQHFYLDLKVQFLSKCIYECHALRRCLFSVCYICNEIMLPAQMC